MFASVVLFAVGAVGIVLGLNVPPPPPAVQTPSSPLAENRVRAPPPLAEYLRQQQSQSQQPAAEFPPQPAALETDSPVAAPPPLSEYRRPQGGVVVDAPQAWRSGNSQLVVPVGPGENQIDSSLPQGVVYDTKVGKKGLTALKDDSLQACFVDNYVDPFFLPHEQRRFYTHHLPGMVLLTSKDRNVFKKIVGEKIYGMCYHARTYWLDNNLFFLFNKLLMTSEVGVINSGGNLPAVQGSNSAQNPQSAQDQPAIRAPPPVD